MNKLPDYLIDNILTFNTPTEIFNFLKSSKNTYNLVKKLSYNNNSFIQKEYNLIEPLINKDTWLDKMDNNFNLKYSSFYEKFLKNIRFNNKRKYCSIFNNFRNIYDTLSNKEYKTKIIKIFFILLLNNYHFYNQKLHEFDNYILKNHILYVFDIFIIKIKYEYDFEIYGYFNNIVDNIFRDIKQNPEIYLSSIIQDTILLNQRYYKSQQLMEILYRKINDYELNNFYIVYENEDDDSDEFHYRTFFSDY